MEACKTLNSRKDRPLPWNRRSRRAGRHFWAGRSPAGRSPPFATFFVARSLIFLCTNKMCVRERCFRFEDTLGGQIRSLETYLWLLGLIIELGLKSG